jgi:hypothetical protein
MEKCSLSDPPSIPHGALMVVGSLWPRKSIEIHTQGEELTSSAEEIVPLCRFNIRICHTIT